MKVSAMAFSPLSSYFSPCAAGKKAIRLCVTILCVSLNLSDSSRAAIIAAVLLAVAFCVVFGFQHGFEEQLGWYVALLPGGVFAASISDIITRPIPLVEPFVFWGLVIVLSMAWYFCVSFAGIKAYRWASSRRRDP